MDDQTHPPKTNDLQTMRVDYTRGALDERDVAADPIEQFSRWFADARNAKLPEPNAMTVATVDSSGQPSARILLLKDVDAQGFTFFTNYESRKAEALAANPRAALLFFWGPLERQVRIEGRVEKVTREESEAYFHLRPRGARIAAWASPQSQVIADRAELESRDHMFEVKFPTEQVPLPSHWGGYRLTPEMIEFWQGRPSRLHDRLRYTKGESGWRLERLSP